MCEFKKSKIKNNSLTRYLFGNKAVLRDEDRIVFAEKDKVNINAWIRVGSNESNIGDLLSVIIIQMMCEKYKIDFQKTTNKTRHLYGIGSILLGTQNACVWGSGFGYDFSSRKMFSILHSLRYSLDIRALRGPETVRILHSIGYSRQKTNVPLGDPAVLLPLFYNADTNEKMDYLIIPHASVFDKYFKQYKKSVISPFCLDWKSFINKILSAKLIISSSLHGLIIAEAYGIPAVMLSDTPSSDITKYKDWYYSTNRYKFPIADSVEEALRVSPSVLDSTVLNNMQSGLIDSFPLDLWS